MVLPKCAYNLPKNFHSPSVLSLSTRQPVIAQGIRCKHLVVIDFRRATLATTSIPSLWSAKSHQTLTLTHRDHVAGGVDRSIVFTDHSSLTARAGAKGRTSPRHPSLWHRRQTPGRVRHQLQVDQRRVDRGVTQPARHEVDRPAMQPGGDGHSCA